VTYTPQPGTIPHKAVQWLQAMEKIAPGGEYSTPDLCDRIGVDAEGFTAYMAKSRKYGAVHVRRKPYTGKLLYWRLGDGTPEADLPPDVAAHDARIDASQQGHRADLKGKSKRDHSFRVLAWDGRLLATGMKIKDGVAIFEPEQVRAIKRHTDWMVAL
jgi:hypothetical protein